MTAPDREIELTPASAANSSARKAWVEPCVDIYPATDAEAISVPGVGGDIDIYS